MYVDTSHRSGSLCQVAINTDMMSVQRLPGYFSSVMSIDKIMICEEERLVAHVRSLCCFHIFALSFFHRLRAS